jgi:hypothetical protein
VTLSELIERVEKLDGPDRETDFAIYQALRPELSEWQDTTKTSADDYWFWMSQREYTASLDAAVALVKRVLPGWGYRVATCCVSDDAWLFPDYNDPTHGERLKREVSEDVDWIEVTDIDLRPPGREPIALVLSLLAALSALPAQERDDAR